MANQAQLTWFHTGSKSSGLSSVDSWATELMEDFYQTTQMATLRFGTKSGLEQSVNATSSGMRVLSRASDAGCLKTYLADGTTSDSSNYGDNCYSDPRYTDWYNAAAAAPETQYAGFSNTYNNSW